jgi:hypothetical protein
MSMELKSSRLLTPALDHGLKQSSEYEFYHEELKRITSIVSVLVYFVS